MKTMEMIWYNWKATCYSYQQLRYTESHMLHELGILNHVLEQVCTL